MGVVLAWSSDYPATVDTISTNFPALTDGTHDVLASHQNAVASAVVALETVVGGLRNAPVADPLSLSDKSVLVFNNAAQEFEADDTLIRADGTVSMTADFDLNFNSLLNGIQGVGTKSADFTVANADTGQWYDCDTDAAAGNINVTLNSGLNTGTLVHFSTKGTGGDVVFVDGGLTSLRGNTTLAQDKVAFILYLTSNDVLIGGGVV